MSDIFAKSTASSYLNCLRRHEQTVLELGCASRVDTGLKGMSDDNSEGRV